MNKSMFSCFFFAIINMVKLMKKGKLIICPHEEKMKILSSRKLEDGFINTRFMTKEEFFQHYFYTYDIDLYYYLMKTYNWHLDVVKEYLSYLPVISIEEEYKDDKLLFLQDLKKELLEKKYISVNRTFHKYLESYEIEVIGYYDFDLYEERILHYTNSYSTNPIKSSCFSFSTMEEEISFVCSKIRDLLKMGVDISHIYLCNVSEDYYYTIHKMFSFYQIPINIPYQNSLFTTPAIVEYLKTGEIPEDASDEIVHKAIQVFNQFSGYSLDDEVVKELLIDCFKHTYLDNIIIEKAVSIVDLKRSSFSPLDYVFVVGMNQEVLPSIAKDTGFLGDSLKEKVSMYTSVYWNQREKKIVYSLLSNISHLTMSYKLATPFMSYYPSSFLMENGISVEEYDVKYSYSHFYNKMKLAEKMDTFSVYGEKEKDLELLYSKYDIPYLKYSHSFTGILNDSYLQNLTYPIVLSYTSLNTYNECRFAYYLKYVLKLDSFQDSFSSFVGSMYHHILSLWKSSSFDLEEEYQNYLQKRELNFKEKMLLIRIKKDLLAFIEILKSQDLLMGYDGILTEEKVEVDISTSVSVRFVGYIDKILFYQKIEDTYFSIIDYKTGNIDTHIEPLKYGLHMQLPVYLYLIHYGRVFANPIFTGVYYQNILFSYPTWSLKLEKEKKDRYFLQGYSIDQIDQLERFDSTYENSELIKSMKYSEKGFGAYSKVMDSDTLFSLIKYTKKIIEEKTDSILHGDFKIDPKIYAGVNVSCRFCPFQDVCFHKEYDNVYLDKVEDLSFLGGEE